MDEYEALARAAAAALQAAGRKAQHDETMATLYEASAPAQRQHEETMVALKALIERTAARP